MKNSFKKKSKSLSPEFKTLCNFGKKNENVKRLLLPIQSSNSKAQQISNDMETLFTETESHVGRQAENFRLCQVKVTNV